MYNLNGFFGVWHTHFIYFLLNQYVAGYQYVPVTLSSPLVWYKKASYLQLFGKIFILEIFYEIYILIAKAEDGLSRGEKWWR